MEGIGKYKIKEEKYDFYEETFKPSQLEGFLEHKKEKSIVGSYQDVQECFYLVGNLKR